ncbi:hypothetical protein GCM10022279_09530 [Comamonas faecalis]|uniref:EAL domain-containing protein n=1 Tax=Comamonas faecalis TaxID=1387849 RepID=A0ABP7QVB3_9BURK
MLLELTQGAALLLALCFLYSAGMRLLTNHPRTLQLLAGLLFGAICIVGMLQPLQLASGVIIDARSVVLSMAALFAGPWAATIAVLLAAAARIALGGTGAAIGVAAIVLSAGAGLLLRLAHQHRQLRLSLPVLLAFGVLLHLAILALFQVLEPVAVTRVNRHLALSYVLVFAPATAFLGWLLRDAHQRQQTEQQLEDSTARLRALTRSIPDPIFVIDDEGHYLEVLTPDDSLLALPARQLVGRRLHDVLPAPMASQLMQSIAYTLHSGQPQNLRFELNTPSGLRHFEARCRPQGMRLHGRAAVVFVAHDRTLQMQVEEALQESEQRLRTLLADMPAVAVQGYRADGAVTFWNQAAEQLYGYSAEEALDSNLYALIIPDAMQQQVRSDVARMFATGEPVAAGELCLRHKSGASVDVFSSHAFVHVPGRPPEMFCIDVDISARKAAEKQALYLSLYDALTGLPNRRLLGDRLQQALAGRTRGGSCAALLFLDIDHFKTLNDSQGHQAGDQLLVQIGERLLACVREHDTVARLGGDEFIVLLTLLSNDRSHAAAQARTLGERILAALRRPVALAGQEHHPTASMGITLISETDTNAEALLQQADLAMYRAKDEGRNQLHFFDPAMQASVDQRLRLQAELHHALQDQQMLLYYQPQVDAQGRVTGAEALLRWQHPTRGLVAPGAFIALAEETGQILELGQWVLQQGLCQQARWRADPQLAPLKLSLNVSARQFRQPGFVDTLRLQLTDSGADPAHIALELTESLLLQELDSVIALMQSLRALGLTLSLDDFGTGYASLNYLKQLPLQQIKIDQGFVRNLLDDPKDAAIATAIVTLADALGLQVIAEGVETAAHHRILLERGCRHFQGYWFGRPMPLADFEAMVRAQHAPTA